MTHNANDPAAPDEPVTPVGEPISIANEFTGVVAQKVLTRNGERLQLTTPKSGYRILLDAMQLEIISALEPEKFSELFARHLGSYDDAPRGGGA